MQIAGQYYKRTGFIADFLTRGERILYRTRLHWVIFGKTLFFLSTGLLLLLPPAFVVGGTTGLIIGSVLPMVLAIFSLFPAMKKYLTSEFVITNKRIIVKSGWLQIDMFDFTLGKVESRHVRQSIWGRVFGFGTVIITGTGHSELALEFLPQPSKFVNQLAAAG